MPEASNNSPPQDDLSYGEIAVPQKRHELKPALLS